MPDQLDPNKYHVMTPKLKRILIVAGCLFLLVVLPLLIRSYYSMAINRPSQITKDVNIEIKSGQGLNEVSGLLFQKGLLNSEILFKVYVLLNRFDKSIQAGNYTIPAGTSVVRLAEILQHGTNDVSIRFTEGWRVEEFARMASLNLYNVNYEEFVREAKPYEGYLFPDTYFVDKDIKADELLDLLKQTFERKTQDLLTGDSLSKAGLTKEQVITFASIVEREVSNEEDRPIVAGILIKRWKNGELIGADATTQYALAGIKNGCGLDSSLKVCPLGSQAIDANWWPNAANFTKDEINFDSSYNTRRNPGLPPAPICSPGLSSIEAVLNSKATDYNFYLTDEDGITHYARTLDEHNANIVRFLR